MEGVERVEHSGEGGAVEGVERVEHSGEGGVRTGDGLIR